MSIFYILLLDACAQNSVRPVAQLEDRQLPRPTRILVDNFAINEKDVTEYQGIMRQQPSNPNPLQRQRAIADKATATVTDQLIYRLRQLGFTVEATASSVVAKGNQVNHTSAEQMTLASSEQTVRFLSEFFARQGWIDPSQVRKAGIATH